MISLPFMVAFRIFLLAANPSSINELAGAIGLPFHGRSFGSFGPKNSAGILKSPRVVLLSVTQAARTSLYSWVMMARTPASFEASVVNRKPSAVRKVAPFPIFLIGLLGLRNSHGARTNGFNAPGPKCQFYELLDAELVCLRERFCVGEVGVRQFAALVSNSGSTSMSQLFSNVQEKPRFHAFSGKLDGMIKVFSFVLPFVVSRTGGTWHFPRILWQ
ncbi:uncharacterized protein BDR25DRAFT_308999 [Lindgomyces ingoldianus]|uniref:Uncharacterized protein n=1 Tax=Lindgomyces ingoldianus TaxID=673940 RepID=A0ACB6RFZ2_9PLEO|nr:uncharacterized protein BDR25DRAFT_308999 [Lindgomyces ingoldianus]KAF2478198.1 hypothetical protein BDR25DRAFT_308999 [Lindgomyces ingoldianus]